MQEPERNEGQGCRGEEDSGKGERSHGERRCWLLPKFLSASQIFIIAPSDYLLGRFPRSSRRAFQNTKKAETEVSAFL
jgi:hypothetical protein